MIEPNLARLLRDAAPNSPKCKEMMESARELTDAAQEAILKGFNQPSMTVLNAAWTRAYKRLEAHAAEVATPFHGT